MYTIYQRESRKVLAQGKESPRDLVMANKSNMGGADLYSFGLRGIDLSRAEMKGANLGCSDISFAKMRNAHFLGADLHNTDLTASDLSHALLTWVNLNSANMSGVRARGATINGADLRFSCMMKADFSDADLSGSKLNSSDLRGSVLCGTNLFGVDLDDVRINQVMGNGNEILTLQTNLYTVTRTYKDMAIGCEQYPIEQWWGFPEYVIDEMDRCALDWWREWKPILQEWVRLSPAVSYGDK